MFSETCIAPVNIAIIKYWGKRDEDLILPVNDSLSITLSTDQMCSKTTVAANSEFKENRMWLNGEEVSFDNNIRLQRCLKELKRLAKMKNELRFPLDWKLHICSENNFPTAAGLASSASGYACLVYTLAKLYGVENSELTSVARLGSGSACRSIYGGFVHWIKGERDDGSDSIAIQIHPPSYWPEMHALILVVNDKKKKTSSKKGMQTTIETSDLVKYRAEVCVSKNILAIKQAIEEKNFPKFGEITMRESNQFHAVCLDSYPPCIYMNDISFDIVEFVHKYNEICGEIKVAYTFDAGPNACLYLLENEVPNVLLALNRVFPNDNLSSVEYIKGIPIDLKNVNPKNELFDKFCKKRNLLKYIIHTKVGEGPRKLAEDDSLLNENGLPKKIFSK